MIVKEIVMSVRFGLGDAEAAVYSDSEIIESINSVLRYANTALVNLNSTIPRKKALLTPANGEVPLPDDFIAMASLDDEDVYLADYEIVGTKLYCDIPLNITYFSTFPSVTALSDTLPLPNYFYELLVRFTESFITKTIDRDMFPQLIYKEISYATSGREYAYLTRPLQFVIE